MNKSTWTGAQRALTDNQIEKTVRVGINPKE